MSGALLVSTPHLQRVCLWSGPRNLSTALMYSFAQRSDTRVFDEPLYAHYLEKTAARTYHPGAEEVLAAMDSDGERVIRDVVLGSKGPYAAATPSSSDSPLRLLFFKNMAHHLVDLDFGFMRQVTNVLLTREPGAVLASYTRQVQCPTLADLGYQRLLELIGYLRCVGQCPAVVDAGRLLRNPRGVLEALCARIDVPFEPCMLSWSPGPRPEDGVWAKHWYNSVHQSRGFAPAARHPASLPPNLAALASECQPHYERLLALAIDP